MTNTPLGATPLAVLDTSTLISAHRHWLWLLARLGFYRGVWSTFIVAELVRVRTEHSLRHGVARGVYRSRINDLVHAFSDVLEVADYRRERLTNALRDPDDEPVLAAALVAGAGFIVSLNTRDFPTSGFYGDIRYVTPDDFLGLLSERGSGVTELRAAADDSRLLP